MLSGVTDLIMMKSDVLDTFKEIKACRAYRVNGKETQRVPFHFTDDDSIEPIYDTIPGWQCDLTAVTREADFPAAFRNYIAYLEKMCIRDRHRSIHYLYNCHRGRHRQQTQTTRALSQSRPSNS